MGTRGSSNRGLPSVDLPPSWLHCLAPASCPLQDRATLAISEDTEEWLIDWNDLHRSKIIGEGAFGKVRREGAAAACCLPLLERRGKAPLLPAACPLLERRGCIGVLSASANKSSTCSREQAA